jgi:mono/diheme cytochrome c family protein
MNPTHKSPSWGEQAQGLLSRWGVASGVVMTFAVFASIVVPAMLRENKLRPPASTAGQAALTPGWLDQAEAPASKGRDLPPVDPATVMTSTPGLLARGEPLFKQNCTSCHGDSGQGNGPASGTLNPRPRNFTQPGGWTHSSRITDIFDTISHGIKSTGMAAFDFIAPADRMALVHYVRSLGKFDHDAEDPKATQALEDQFRSKGVHIPNRIPVSLAIRKMVAEQPTTVRVALPPANDNSPLAQLLRSAMTDPDHVSQTVARTRHGQDWAAVAREWTTGSPGNGFAPSVASMSSADWRELVTALLGSEALADPPAQGQLRNP